ncbi:TPA: hypothetical protein ACSP3H_000992 [Aeromonas veronii]|uniref:hypothetical protein n=1 Tax=Aeromonas rivipollensis TaxID=948519 RepID=UPI0013D49DC5|nr:hypothetical protein [Aeromonas rivipollensis]NEX82726.1 hypothetical protein [Aeromonas rivipollensis]
MNAKQKGKCPFCEKNVSAVVLEANTVRRDRCECPSCKESIYLCRIPGCHDYAKGTSVYDHELCPSCTDKINDISATAGKYALEAGKAIVVALVLGKLGAKK